MFGLLEVLDKPFHCDPVALCGGFISYREAVCEEVDVWMCGVCDVLDVLEYSVVQLRGFDCWNIICCGSVKL